MFLAGHGHNLAVPGITEIITGLPASCPAGSICHAIYGTAYNVLYKNTGQPV